MKKSAGILMYRRKEGQLQVLLVHPGGPFWKKRDAGAWSIPKGEVNPDEDPLTAAAREFYEETGFRAEGEFIRLPDVVQKGGKQVCAWAVPGDIEVSVIASNTFEMEWPPRSGRKAVFPEVDRADWFFMKTAREKILPGQLPLLDAFESMFSMKRS